MPAHGPGSCGGEDLSGPLGLAENRADGSGVFVHPQSESADRNTSTADQGIAEESTRLEGPRRVAYSSTL